MMSAATDLIVRYYDAIERRDLEAVMAMTHPEVHFHDFLDGGEIEG
jgi:ketosteroid isomerase-like protein